MADAVLLDAGPLGMLAHPRPNPLITAWLKRISAQGARIFVPEIADYEVRRDLLRAGLIASVARLDHLKTTLGFAPLTTPIMLLAAEYWAQTRRRGMPTAADAALDGDVILAAQATSLQQSGLAVVVATQNIGHLSRFVPARNWDDPAW